MKNNLRTTIKPYEGKINTVFHNDTMPREVFRFIFLSVILNDSVYKKG